MKNLSIVIPCYNEGENILKLFELCRKAIKNRNDIEVVFVNNGSTDLTRKFIEQSVLKDKYSFAKLCNVENNIGYGNGILKGLELANGKILSWTHADLQTDPKDVIACFELYKKDLYNSKCIVKGSRKKRNIFDTLFTYGMSLVSSFLLKSRLWDINAQPKVFNKSFMKILINAPIDFSLDLYFLYISNKNNIKINSYPVYFHDRLHGIAKGGGSLMGKIKLIKRTFKYILKLRKEIRNGNK